MNTQFSEGRKVAHSTIVFGPVPSRRLGRSLGINNIPPKLCSYSCAYCQVGRTLTFQTDRHTFYDPQSIFTEVRERVSETHRRNDTVDYLAFVPDGEPTLDANLGRSLELLKTLGIKTAVINNGSLIDRDDVKRDLAMADWVSFKVDSTIESIWRRANRPHRSLVLDSILSGMVEFRQTYRGELVTETMLIKGVNDGEENLEAVARFLSLLQPSKAYVSIPTRPPAESSVRIPEEEAINRAYHILGREVERVEYLIGYEGDAFAFTGNPEQDLLSITAVHPMREDAVAKLLSRTGAGWSIVRNLITENRLIETVHAGQKVFVRRFEKREP